MSISPIDPNVKQLAEQIAAAVLKELRKGDSPIPPEYLSPRQVFQLTSISTKTLEAMRGVRTGPPYYKVGGRVRYKIQDIRDYIEKEGPVK